MVSYMEYDENVSKKNVQRNLDNIVREESLCIGELGLSAAIKWEDKVFEDRISARKYLDKNCKGKPVAVKYRIPIELLKTNKIERLEDRLKSMLEVREKYIERNNMTNYKKPYFTCKNCGSKVATKYMRSNNCRVCGAEARSDVVLNKIKDMEEKYGAFKSELDAKIEELSTGCHGRWLVRFEYETPEEVA